MIDRLNNAVLRSDLDANSKRILNVGQESTFNVSNLLLSDDPRLDDERMIPDGSVTDSSVAFPVDDVSGISQSKLLLDGDLPANYLGATSNKAAQGDLYQPLADKNQPDGYAPLDGDGRLTSGVYPFSTGGTVNQIRLSIPSGEFSVANPVITLADDFEIFWNSKPGPCWFGVSGTLGAPRFNSTPVPADMVPGLDVSKITSGMFHVEQLPAAVGVGAEHSVGIVPDTSETGDPGDYLARDMTFKRFQRTISYQPNLPSPVITVAFYSGGNAYAYLSITSSVPGAKLFYRVDFDGTFIPATYPVVVPVGSIVEAYAAKPGYNTSDFTQFTIPTPT